jgi:hypothetical protein
LNDFIKIFLVLCACVAAFAFGRNYGETTYKDSPEFKEMIRNQEESNFKKAELENVKTKLQNIADNAENTKQEQMMAQILQIMIADLGLRISNPDAFVKSSPAMAAPAPAKAQPKETLNQLEKKPIAAKPEKKFDYRKLKSYEWILQNSTDANELKKNLNNVEIKDIDTYLKDSKAAGAAQLEPLYGSYRGRIMDITNKEYGSLAIEIFPVIGAPKPRVKGSIKIFRNGNQEMSDNFSADQLGLVGPGSTGFVLDYANRFFQVYKISETQQLAGFYYERLVSSGATKKIGTFILNRTDQF